MAKTNGVNEHHAPKMVDIDALVVDAGFGGIYQLKRFRDMGLVIKSIDTAGDVGSTWYWNQYPGAISDTEAYLYRYSWDADDLQSYPWEKHNVYQAGVLKYLQHVVERHDLRRDILFETTLTDAALDDKARVWIVKTSTGATYNARYLVTALGLLSKQNFPDIAGIDTFQGENYHTGARHTGVSLQGNLDPGTRNEIFETAWTKGGGFRFMFETFNDISTDEAANDQAAEFINAKIRTKVKDPVKARKLMSTQLYARGPLCNAGYYEQFNRSNVEVVNLHETPIDAITPKGIRTSDGTEHELDVIIFVTGFDAMDGNYTRIAIKGRNGLTLKEHWEGTGPTSSLGVSVSGFPNMFMALGPNGPFCNIPPAIETHVEFISDIVEAAESAGRSAAGRSPVIEATAQAEERWTNECDRISRDSLFRRTDSWIFGANVPGKKHAVTFYFGGLADYRAKLHTVAKNGYEGFVME